VSVTSSRIAPGYHRRDSLGPLIRGRHCVDSSVRRRSAGDEIMGMQLCKKLMQNAECDGRGRLSFCIWRARGIIGNGGANALGQRTKDLREIILVLTTSFLFEPFGLGPPGAGAALSSHISQTHPAEQWRHRLNLFSFFDHSSAGIMVDIPCSTTNSRSIALLV